MNAAGPARHALLWHRGVMISLLVLQLGLGAVGVGAWRMDHPPSVPAFDAAETARAAFPTSIESAWPLALSWARTWRENARVVSQTMQVDWPWEVAPTPSSADGGYVTFVFASDEPEAATLSVIVERLSGTVVGAETQRWDDHLPQAVAVTGPAVTSLDAQSIAEESGGRAFRQACPAQRHLSRIALVTNDPQSAGPYWLVGYEDVRQPSLNGLELRIDANTAGVLDVRDRSTACDEASAAPHSAASGTG